MLHHALLALATTTYAQAWPSTLRLHPAFAAISAYKLWCSHVPYRARESRPHVHSRPLHSTYRSIVRHFHLGASCQRVILHVSSRLLLHGRGHYMNSIACLLPSSPFDLLCKSRYVSLGACVCIIHLRFTNCTVAITPHIHLPMIFVALMNPLLSQNSCRPCRPPLFREGLIFPRAPRTHQRRRLLRHCIHHCDSVA